MSLEDKPEIKNGPTAIVWRTLSLDPKDGQLYTVGRRVRINDGLITAECTLPHEPVQAGCFCGVHAYYEPAEAWKTSQYTPESHLKVLARGTYFGRTVVATHGIRTANFRIQKIWIVDGKELSDDAVDKLCDILPAADILWEDSESLLTILRG